MKWQLWFILFFTLLFVLCISCVSFQTPVPHDNWQIMHLYLSIFPFYFFTLLYGMAGVFLWYYVRVRRVACLFLFFCLMMMIAYAFHSETSSHSFLFLSHTAFSFALLLYAFLLLDFPRRIHSLANTALKRGVVSTYLLLLFISTGVVLVLLGWHFLTGFYHLPVRFSRLITPLDLFQETLAGGGILCTIGVSWKRGRNVHEPLLHQLVLLGSIIAFGALFLFNVLPSVLFGFPWLSEDKVLLLSGILPLFIGYAVFRFQLFWFDASIKQAIEGIMMIVAMNCAGFGLAILLLLLHVPISLFSLVLGFFLILVCFKPLLFVVERVSQWFFSSTFTTGLRLMVNLNEGHPFSEPTDSLNSLSLRLCNVLFSGGNLAALLFLQIDIRGFLLCPSCLPPSLFQRITEQIPLVSREGKMWIEAESPFAMQLREPSLGEPHQLLVPLRWEDQLTGVLITQIQQDHVEFPGQMELLQTLLQHCLSDLEKARREEIQLQRQQLLQNLVQNNISYQTSIEQIEIETAHILSHVFTVSADIWHVAQGKTTPEHRFHTGPLTFHLDPSHVLSLFQIKNRSVRFYTKASSKDELPFPLQSILPQGDSAIALIHLGDQFLILAGTSLLVQSHQAIMTEFVDHAARLLSMVQHHNDLERRWRHKTLSVKSYAQAQIDGLDVILQQLNDFNAPLAGKDAIQRSITIIHSLAILQPSFAELLPKEDSSSFAELYSLYGTKTWNASHSREKQVGMIVDNRHYRFLLKQLLISLGYQPYEETIEEFSKEKEEQVTLVDAMAYSQLLAEPHHLQLQQQTAIFVLYNHHLRAKFSPLFTKKDLEDQLRMAFSS